MLLNVLSVPVMAYIIRRLGASNFGQWALAMSLVGTASGLANLGLRGLFVRSLSRQPESAARATAEQLGLRLTLAGFAAVVAVVGCGLMGYSRTVVACTAVASLGMMFTTVSLTTADLLQAFHRLPVLAGINLAAGVVLTCASIFAAWLDAGPVVFTVSYTLGPVVSATLSLALIRRQYFPPRVHFDPRRFWGVIKDSRFFAVQQFVSSVSFNAESLLTPKLVGITQFGYFSAGILLPDRLSVVNEGICTSYYPVIAKAWRDDPRLASRQVMRCLSFVLLGCLPLLVLGLFFAEPIARILFPAQAETCRRIIVLTMWALPLMGVENIMGYSLNAAGQDARQARLTVLMGVCTLLLAVGLIWQWGLIGACCSWVLRHAVRASLRLPDFLRTFSPSPADLPLLRIFACAGIMAGLMWLTDDLLFADVPASRIHAVAVLAAKAIAGLLVYVAALFVVRIVNKADMLLLFRRDRAS